MPGMHTCALLMGVRGDSESAILHKSIPTIHPSPEYWVNCVN